MARTGHSVTILTSTGDVVPNAPIEIRLYLNDLLANIFEQDGTPITQTGATADENGIFRFWADPNEYFARHGGVDIPVTVGVDADTLYRNNRLTPSTVSDALYDTRLVAGDKLVISEYAAGFGGGATWLASESSSVTVNGFDVIQCVGVPSLAISLIAGDDVSIRMLGALGDGADSTLIEQFASENYKSITVPSGTYLRTGTVTIKSGQSWIMENPTYTQNGSEFTTIFEAADVTDWAILGRTQCIGSLTDSGDVGGENGLVIKGCGRYTVDNFHCSNMRSHGIHIQEGTLAPAPRGDQGQVNFCSTHQSRFGLVIDPHTSAEFNIITGFTAAGNIDGVIVGAGNSSLVGGNIVDNTRGIEIIGGDNHAHGIVSGVNINHNGINVKCTSVVNGHTFDACHAYGNGGISSPIWFENSKGCTFQNGVIDCPVYNDGAVGQNGVINNYMPAVSASILGSDTEFLRVLGNWTPTGSWVFNDSAQEYTLATRGVSSQPVPSGTNLIFNSATKDKRGNYDTSSGEYTAAVAGVYGVKVQATITGTGFSAAGASFASLMVDGITHGYMLVTPVSDTVAIGVLSKDLLLTAGNVVKIVSSIGGVSPELAITTSSFSIELR